jgi:hypothetical protein
MSGDNALSDYSAMAVAALSPYFEAVSDKVTDTVSEAARSLGKRLYGVLKNDLESEDTKRALARLEADPADGDTQAALRVTLKEILANDPQLLAKIRELLASQESTARFNQTALIRGNQSSIVQIGGNSYDRENK